LSIPAVGVEAPVVPVRISAGALGVPQDVRTLGWWTGGAAPGSALGTVLIDGHVDSARQGVGVLSAIARLPVGGSISLVSGRGTTSYLVQARRSYAKNALPGDLLNRTGAPRLVLITCAGPFDATTGHYRDNLVVYATPTARGRTN